MITLEELAAGTRVRMASGDTATLLFCNFTRARIRLDRKAVKTFVVHDADGNEKPITAAYTVERDVAPASEVEVIDND